MRKLAFTLIELLAVVGIIAILSAILYPTIASAKRSALRTQCISNMRQCGLALAMYADGGPESIPTYEFAIQTLPSAATCDPEDHLRANCRTEPGKPVIGSYGYVRGIEGLQYPARWSDWLLTHPNAPVMVCPHHGDGHLQLFDGNDLNPCIQTGDCVIPSRVNLLMIDTSVRTRFLTGERSQRPGATRLLFTWDALFELP